MPYTISPRFDAFREQAQNKKGETLDFLNQGHRQRHIDAFKQTADDGRSASLNMNTTRVDRELSETIPLRTSRGRARVVRKYYLRASFLGDASRADARA